MPACFFEKKAHGLDVALADLAKKKDVKKVFRLGLGSKFGNNGIAEVKVDGYMNWDSAIREVQPGEECPNTKLAMVVWKSSGENLKGEVGQVTNICDEPQCSKHHGSGSSSGTSSSGAKVPLKGLAFVEKKAENLKASLNQRVRWATFKELSQKLLQTAWGDVVSKYADTGISMEIAAETALEHLYYDSCRDACKALGMEKPKDLASGRTDWAGSLSKHFKGNSWALLLAVNAAEDIRSDHKKDGDSRLYQLANLYKVDVKAIRKELALADSGIIAGMKKRAAQKASREKGAKLPAKTKAKK